MITKIAIIGSATKTEIAELLASFSDVEFICVDSITALPKDEACIYKCYTKAEHRTYPPNTLVEFVQVKIDKATDKKPQNRKERRAQALKRTKPGQY